MESFHYLIGENGAHISWWQMGIRAAIIFIYAVFIYRIAPRRSFARLSAFDVVLSVIMGSGLSRALTGNAPLLPTLVAIALLIALHCVLAALAPRSEFLSYIIKGRPVRLISNGVVDWEAAEKSRLGERDLTEQLRLKGLRGPAKVEVAYIERNGAISVVKAQDK